MSSILHRLPLEILSLVARFSSISGAAALSSVDKTLHNRLAWSSIFRRRLELSYTHGGSFDPSHCTQPQVWADIFNDTFSASAIVRRSFAPTLSGYASQLVLYYRVIRWVSSFPPDELDFGRGEDSFEDQCLEPMFLMLIECDGKNTWQLERAGAYEYCKAWVLAKLFPVDDTTGCRQSTWPREDRFVAYALWNLWLLTTHDRLVAESQEETVLLKDILFRFCFASYRYPHSYAPLSRYVIPLPFGTSSPSQQSSNPNSSVAGSGVLPYPVYRSYNAPYPRLNTKPSQVAYYGSILSWSPPLITAAAKLLYTCRTFPFGMPPDIHRNRDHLLQDRSNQVEQAIAGNQTLRALHDLTEIHGLAQVNWMVQERQLPPQVASLPGLHEAWLQLRYIEGPNGPSPRDAVGATQPDMLEWNSRRETPFHFRGGQNEDGDDPNNRQWAKALVRDQHNLRPAVRTVAQLGLPYTCRNVSAVHDGLFWRLQLCADPWDQHRGFFDVLSAEDIEELALTLSLRERCSRLTPGRPWTPGLLNGLFQGVLLRSPEEWLLDCYRSNSFAVPVVGENSASTVGIRPYPFFGRFQEHHQLFQYNVPTVPITCDSRSFPRNVLQPGQAPTPITPFSQSIDPGEEWIIDEGGMNAFLPENFRCSHTTHNGRPVAHFGWGPPGPPTSDRCTVYETFMPDQASSHDPSICPACSERSTYLEHVEKLRLSKQTKWEQDIMHKAEGIFGEFGLSRGSPGPHSQSTRPSHSPTQLSHCDGVVDIIITGETDLRHGQAWSPYNFLGRIRKWDGLVCILRLPKNPQALLQTVLIYGYFETDVNFVGNWRLVPGDRVGDVNTATPPRYNPAEGLTGSGLQSNGGSGVLGDGMRVVQEGPFTMTRVVEDE